MLDFAERARAGGWSLRSALVRYAQPQPRRVSQVLELVRRIEFAVHPLGRLFAGEGRQIWSAAESGAAPSSEEHGVAVGLVRAAAELDRLADRLVAWAVDRAGPRPDDEVDSVVLDVTRRLDDLGVAREEQRPGPPPGARRRG
jgi:hypothetical protein